MVPSGVECKRIKPGIPSDASRELLWYDIYMDDAPINLGNGMIFIHADQLFSNCSFPVWFCYPLSSVDTVETKWPAKCLVRFGINSTDQYQINQVVQ